MRESINGGGGKTMETRSLRLGRAWDEEFNDLADELLFGRRSGASKAPAAKSSWSGAGAPARAAADYPGKGTQADVYARLSAMAKGSRQVMVKVTGGSKTAKSMGRHFDYLSKENELELTDQDGNPVDGKDARKDLTWAWVNTGPEIDEGAQRKESFNIVFSMPEGTDARALADAVRATAGAEFAGHQWVIVQHFDEPQVHAHIAVKTESLSGERLNPRKADLQRWRERFAYELRVRGVDAEATRRAPRLQREKMNKPWAVTRLEERGLPTNPRPEVDKAKAEAWERSAKRTIESHGKIISALSVSGDVKDRALAQDLSKMLSERVAENTKSVPREPVGLER